jgi:hypothetical protein
LAAGDPGEINSGVVTSPNDLNGESVGDDVAELAFFLFFFDGIRERRIDQ